MTTSPGTSVIALDVDLYLRHSGTYRVLVDGEAVADLDTSKASMTIDVAPGRRRLKINGRGGLNGSNELDLEVLPDDVVPVAVEQSETARLSPNLSTMLMFPTITIRRRDNDPGKRTA